MDASFAAEAGNRRVEGVRRLLLSAVVVGVLGTTAVHGAVAAMAASTSTGGDFTAGSLHLTGGSDEPMFSLSDLRPGETARGFTGLRYDGTLPAEVRLYASASGGGLARFLTVTVTRGTGRGPGFVADPVDHGRGPGVLFEGTLAAFPRDWASGIADPGTWTAGQARTYRFEVRLSEGAAPGLSAGASFRWEARNR